MKKLLSSFIAVFCFASAFSQVDSVTYGISLLQQGTGMFLSKITLPEGVVSLISVDTIEQIPGWHGRTIDPLKHIFYYATGSDLLAIDLNTGELTRKVTIINHPGTVFHGINFNSKDTTLYGLAVDTAGRGILLARIDPVTGTVKAISDTIVAAGYNVLAGTALDPVHGIYYFETLRNPANHLLGMNLDEGAIVSDAAIGIDSADRFGPIAFNCHDSTLYGLAGSYSQRRKLATIDPSSGEVTLLSWFPPADTLLNEQATIDPFNRVFYFESIDRTYRGVDLVSGDLVSYTKITPVPGTYFTSFLFNNACYFPAPAAIGEGPAKPELTVFPNPASRCINVRSSVPLMRFEILDYTGKTLVTQNCAGRKEIQADLTGLSAGIYIIRVSDERTCVSLKFIKN